MYEGLNSLCVRDDVFDAQFVPRAFTWGVILNWTLSPGSACCSYSVDTFCNGNTEVLTYGKD